MRSPIANDIQSRQRMISNTSDNLPNDSNRSSFFNEWKSMSSLFTPIFLINFFEMTIILMDIMMLGHIDNDNITGGSIGYNIISLLWVFNEGIVLTLDTLGAISYGHKSLFEIRLWTYIALILITMICILEMVLLLCYPLLSSILFPRSYNLYVDSIIFVYFFLPTLFLLSYYKVIQKYLQVQKVMMPLIYISLGGAIFHLIGNSIFIYALDMGVAGCGLSALLTRLLQLLSITAYVITRKMFLSEAELEMRSIVGSITDTLLSWCGGGCNSFKRAEQDSVVSTDSHFNTHNIAVATGENDIEMVKTNNNSKNTTTIAATTNKSATHESSSVEEYANLPNSNDDKHSANDTDTDTHNNNSSNNDENDEDATTQLVDHARNNSGSSSNNSNAQTLLNNNNNNSNDSVSTQRTRFVQSPLTILQPFITSFLYLALPSGVMNGCESTWFFAGSTILAIPMGSVLLTTQCILSFLTYFFYQAFFIPFISASIIRLSHLVGSNNSNSNNSSSNSNSSSNNRNIGRRSHNIHINNQHMNQLYSTFRFITFLCFLLNFLTTSLLYLITHYTAYSAWLTTDTEVQHQLQRMAPWIALFQFSFGLNASTQSILRTFGMQFEISGFALLSLLILGLSISYILCYVATPNDNHDFSVYGFGLYGLWVGMSVGAVVFSMSMWLFTHSIDWKDEKSMAYYQRRTNSQFFKFKISRTSTSGTSGSGSSGSGSSGSGRLSVDTNNIDSNVNDDDDDDDDEEDDNDGSDDDDDNGLLHDGNNNNNNNNNSNSSSSSTNTMRIRSPQKKSHLHP